MASSIRVYRLNTGSCGGCDSLIELAVRAGPELAWAESPYDADVLLLTGPITPVARPAVLALWRELAGRVPLIAVGRCAIDGQPFGRGGLAELPEIAARVSLDGCPPARDQLLLAVRNALGIQGGAIS